MQLIPLKDEPLVIGQGFRAHGLRASQEVLDPLLMIDHFFMTAPTFGPHPHAGFSAVTYLFADSTTGFHNRDSTGDDSEIHPGDAHWMVAGRGMVHDEVPLENGKLAHGLQLFVRLATKDHGIAPYPLKIRRVQMPQIAQDQHQTTLAWGLYDDGDTKVKANVAVPTHHTLLDITLSAQGKPFHYPLPQDEHVILLVIAGEVMLNQVRIEAPQAFQIKAETLSMLSIAAHARPSQVVLLMGPPLCEPVFQYGPFALATRAHVQQAIEDYQAGKMGKL